MSIDKLMGKMARPMEARGTAGAMMRGATVYRGGVNNPVSGSRTVPGLKKPKKLKIPNSQAIQSYLTRG